MLPAHHMYPASLTVGSIECFQQGGAYGQASEGAVSLQVEGAMLRFTYSLGSSGGNHEVRHLGLHCCLFRDAATQLE